MCVRASAGRRADEGRQVMRERVLRARACPARVRVRGISRVLAVWRCLIYARKVGVYLG